MFNRRRHQDEAHRGFAVVDVETTGLSPRRDRVIELGIVSIDPELVIRDLSVSLINPHRDVGRTRLHGITATNVADVPSLDGVAGEVAARLTGRVFVGHNAQFDLGMIEGEFDRLGCRMPSVPTLCTMRIASVCLDGLTRTTLEACCAAAGVRPGTAHTALADATASAHLLQTYVGGRSVLPAPWQAELRRAVQMAWPAVPPARQFSPITRDAGRRKRISGHSPLSGLLDILPPGPITPFQSYFTLLPARWRISLSSQAKSTR